MNDDEINGIVKAFLGTQAIQFSLVWEKDLCGLLKRVREKNIRVLVKTIHDNKIQEIKETCKRWLLAGFPKANADDIIQEALISWLRSNFDGTIAAETENPELAALWQQVRWRNMDANDETKNLKIIEYRENSFDIPDESDEANISSDEFFSDENELDIASEISGGGIENKDANEYFHEEVIENLPAETEPEPTKENGNFSSVYLTERSFVAFATEEAITFYRLSKKKYEVRFHQPSQKYRTFKPLRKNLEDETRKEFHNLEYSTRHYKERFNFLKNAERRRWMEVAITEMKLSKAKFEKKIEELKKEDSSFEELDYRSKKPLLSAVAIDKHENRIATCFKGGVDFIDDEGADKTWDLHCEYALFKHVIKNDRMHLLKDGTLFVTLEPCNKRGYWLDGEVEKPKVPCAVRCVQSGAQTVYVGTPDDNPEVYMQGIEILSTGKFTFRLRNGRHVGNPKEVKAAELLESYFRDIENYPAENFADKIIYNIGEPLNVILFDWDLMEVVRSINSTFLQRHNKDSFI